MRRAELATTDDPAELDYHELQLRQSVNAADDQFPEAPTDESPFLIPSDLALMMAMIRSTMLLARHFSRVETPFELGRNGYSKTCGLGTEACGDSAAWNTNQLEVQARTAFRHIGIKLPMQRFSAACSSRPEHNLRKAAGRPLPLLPQRTRGSRGAFGASFA